jgi:hypothetical protein
MTTLLEKVFSGLLFFAAAACGACEGLDGGSDVR